MLEKQVINVWPQRVFLVQDKILIIKYRRDLGPDHQVGDSYNGDTHQITYLSGSHNSKSGHG